MDIFLWLIVAFTQAAVAFLGVLAINGEFAKDNFKTIVVAFIALTVAGVIASGWSFARASRYSEMVSQLTERILFEVRGSPDSYIVIHPSFSGKEDYENGLVTFSYYNESKYPLMETSVVIVGNMGVEEIPRYGRRIGDVLSEHGGDLSSLTVKLSKERDNRIDFAIDSRSVTLWEYFYITWNGKGWFSDYSLRKKVGAKGEEVYIKKLREDFPFIKQSSWLNEREIEKSDTREAEKGNLR